MECTAAFRGAPWTVTRQQSDPAHVVVPGAHRIASLPERWLLGTHPGRVSHEHLDAYLNEFTFRFNRYPSRRRGLLFYGLLEQAVAADPIAYRSLVVNPTPRPPTCAPIQTRSGRRRSGGSWSLAHKRLNVQPAALVAVADPAGLLARTADLAG